MTPRERQQFDQVTDKLTEFEEATVQAVAEIDQCDGSRLAMQETLDSVRETLTTTYGDNFDDALNEHLETLGDENDDENDDDEDEDDDEIEGSVVYF